MRLQRWQGIGPIELAVPRPTLEEEGQTAPVLGPQIDPDLAGRRRKALLENPEPPSASGQHSRAIRSSIAPMTQRSALAPLLVFAAVTGSGVAACGDKLIAAMSGDSGTNDATVGASDAMAGEAEASCAFDAGLLDDAEVAFGKQIVTACNCQDCHGGTLSGNFNGVPSPTTEGGFAYPPNLTPDPTTGLGCWTNAEIENAILNGIDNEGMRLCPPMPLWGHLTDGGLDAGTAYAVVQYLRSLPIFSEQVPNTPTCSEPQPVADDAAVEMAPDAEAEAAVGAQSEASADAPREATADASAGVGADAGSGPEGGDAELTTASDANDAALDSGSAQDGRLGDGGAIEGGD